MEFGARRAGSARAGSGRGRRSPPPVPAALGPRTAVPEQRDRGLVPPPRLALLQQHPLHDLLLVRQPVHGEHVEPAQDEDAQGAGAHGQAGTRPLPRQPRHPPPAPAAPPRLRAALPHQARAMRSRGRGPGSARPGSVPLSPAAARRHRRRGSGAAAAAAPRLAPVSAAVAAAALPHSHLVPRLPRQMMLRRSPPSPASRRAPR